MERNQRIEIVNKIVTEIAARGRQFFKSKKTADVGYFLEKKNRLFWRDECSGKEIYTGQMISNIKGFTHGGTLKHLIFNEFKCFIQTGQAPIMIRYSGLMGLYWGYADEDLRAIWEIALHVGYISNLSTTSD